MNNPGAVKEGEAVLEVLKYWTSGSMVRLFDHHRPLFRLSVAGIQLGFGIQVRIGDYSHTVGEAGETWHSGA